MGFNSKTVGGSPVAGLPTQFTNFLSSGLSGTFGGGAAAGQAGAANPVGSTQGIAGILNGLLSPGAGQVGGALQSLIQNQQKQQQQALTAQFGAQGGTAFGTGAQYGLSTLMAQQSPQLINAIGGLQQSAINSLLPYYGQATAQGTPQATTIEQPSTLQSILQLVGPASSLLGAAGGGAGAAAAGAGAGGGASLLTTLPEIGAFASYQPSTFLNNGSYNPYTATTPSFSPASFSGAIPSFAGAT